MVTGSCGGSRLRSYKADDGVQFSTLDYSFIKKIEDKFSKVAC